MKEPEFVCDLFCGAGGAAMGLHRAWPHATIIGVDIKPQPRYPFTFVQHDAFDYFLRHGNEIDFIWSSPVCKRYTRMTNCRPGLAGSHPDQVSTMREWLSTWGGPCVIENVSGAPLINPIVLCGAMFGLNLYRHRLFESNFVIEVPPHPPHERITSRAGHWRPGTIMSVAGNFAPVAEARKAMGIEWMTRDELSQAVPPDYSEYIGLCYLDA